VRRLFLGLGVVAMFLMASCGQSYEVKGITVTPAYVSLAQGGSQQFTVTATFSNSQTEDVTLRSSYSLGASAADAANKGVAPLTALTYNNSGYLQVVGGACTFTNSNGAKVGNPYSLNISYTNNGKNVTTVAQIDVSSTCP